MKYQASSCSYDLSIGALACASALIAPSFNAQAEDAKQDLELSTVVVTAAGFEQDVTDAPASISVLTRDQLQDKNFSSLAEALADIPGVDVRSGTGKTGGFNINIRGMPSDYTLILIDGRRQNTSGSVTPNGFGETSTSFLPPLSQIERIEVIRGPMSTLYGSDAMGGVVNIITRAVGREWNGSLNLQTTLRQNSDDAHDGTVEAFTSGPLWEDILGLQVRAKLFERGSSERLDPNGTGRDPRPAEGQIGNLGGRLTLRANENHRIWFDTELVRQRYDNSDSRLGTLDRPPNNFRGYSDELRFNRDQFLLGHRGDFSFGTWETTASHITTETRGRTLPAGNVPEYGYHAVGGEPRILENRDLIIDSRLNMSLGQHMLTLGGQYIDAQMEDGAAGDTKFEQYSWSLFGEDEWQFLDNWALTAGLRYDHHKAFGGHLSPRGYLVWQPLDQWTFKGGVSQGYKTPTLNQLHDGITGFSAQGQSVTIGSPDLKPEESTSFELSGHYDSGALSAGITFFLNQFSDRIATGDAIPNCLHPLGNVPGCMTVGNFSQQTEFSKLVNIDEAETRGVETTVSYRFLPDWEISGNYTYTDTEVQSGAGAGQLLTNTPKHMANATLRWDVTPAVNVRLEAEYYSSRERFTGTLPTAGQNLALYQAAGNKLKGYELLHLAGTWRVNNSLKINGRIYNLLGKDFTGATPYEWNGDTYYAFDYTQTNAATSGAYLPDRSLWLSMNYEF